MNPARPEPLAADSDEFVDIVNSPLWRCELKLNGARGIQRGPAMYTRNGNKYRYDVNYKKLPEGCILDGEIYKGEFYVFDVIQINGHRVSHLPLIDRLDWLTIVDCKKVPCILNKKECLKIAKKSRAEGVVFKHLESSYPWGKTLSWRKIRL